MFTALHPASPSGMVVLRRVGVAVLVVTGLVALVVPMSGERGVADWVAHVAAAGVLVGSGVTLALLREVPRPAVLVMVQGSIAVVGVLAWVAEPMTVEPLLVVGPVLLLAGFFEAGETWAGYLLGVVVLVAALGLDTPTELETVSVAVAVVVSGLLALLVRAGAREPVSPEEARRAEHARGGPMSEPELRARLEVLAEVAIVQGSPLALVLVAPLHPKGTGERHVRAQLVRALTAQSRGDDLIAELDDAVGVLLPGSSQEEATGYAARVSSALVRPAPQGIDQPVALGVSQVIGDAYPAAALLRRAREAMEAARTAGDGRYGLAERAGVVLVAPQARSSRARGSDRRAARV